MRQLPVDETQRTAVERWKARHAIETERVEDIAQQDDDTYLVPVDPMDELECDSCQ